MMFNKILIANRGEIACRIIKTAKQMGIKTVAVYSEADADALHVTQADEAYLIGPPPAKESYLQYERIIEICKLSQAEAVHPGYGFLSENESFASALENNGIIFIGPPASAISSMGSKSQAKAIMEKAGVPLVQGYHGDIQNPDFLAKEADKIGYPVLIKATAGGGGKGMRIVTSENEFANALASCKREAIASFGDDNVLIEKYLTKPRHIEIQIFADTHQNAVHLFERDCSVQRRHQKVIEEAPAPGLSEDTRNVMGEVAIKAARAIDYVGAGTVEFLYDEDGSFYFMEMNTRLQVEHPVTEMITGLDLVEWQLLVAAGHKLPLQQSAITQSGHAFEVRVYAEDPDNDFLPATGKLNYLNTPEASPYVRVDSGVQQGDSISIHYDPMIAKLIVWDTSRTAALSRLRGALSQYHVVGTNTNINFLHALSSNEHFEAADLDTRFIEKHKTALFPEKEAISHETLVIAALYSMLKRTEEGKRQSLNSHDPYSPWHLVNGWRLNEDNHNVFCFLEPGNDDKEHLIVVHFRPGAYLIEISGNQYLVKGEVINDHQIAVDFNGKRMRATVVESNGELSVLTQNSRSKLHVKNLSLNEDALSDGNNLVAPMPGTVVDVLVKAGERVKSGSPLMILEAMKMEHTITAPSDGTIKDVLYQKGDLVEGDAELVIFEGVNP